MLSDPAWRKSTASKESNCVEAAGNWRKSSASTFNGNCAEVGQDGADVLVRDTLDRGGPVLTFPAAAWERFTAKMKGAT
jgi:hypothetical protein